MKSIDLFSVCLLLVALGLMPSARAAMPGNVHISQVSNTVVVTYDLIGSPEERCDIRIVFQARTIQRSIVPINLWGDLKNVVPGTGKTITWDARADLGSWSGEIKAVITVLPAAWMPSTVVRDASAGGPSNALLSAFCPGLGDVFVNGEDAVMIKPGYITLGFLASLGCAFYSREQMKNNYTAYHSAVQQYEINGYYEKAEYYRKNANFFTGMAACIWAGDVLRVLLKGISNTSRGSLGLQSKSQTVFDVYAGPVGASARLCFRF
ncbi:MAG: hypothetical protein IPP38_10975 [Bacteroidetes bacterium]|nr:hypothetical protein [Bacteroidota bacterium]